MHGHRFAPLFEILILAASLALLGGAAGCATGDAPPTDGGGEAMDGGGGRDAGRPDSGGGMVTCAEGQHRCGGGCINDFPDNLPETGCRYGCGEPCPSPEQGLASCTAEGECTWECEPPFRRDGEDCVCAPTTSCEAGGFECGAIDDGCGTILDCGGCGGTSVCMEGRCACEPDMGETGMGNNIRVDALHLGNMNDGTDEDREYGYNLHTMSDEDWFYINVTDGGNVFNNPQLIVSLTNIPVGADYDLSAYYLCNGGTDISTCAAGDVDNDYGRGCSSTTSGMGNESVTIDTECDHLSASEDGVLLIHVRSKDGGWALSCANYRLVVGIN